MNWFAWFCVAVAMLNIVCAATVLLTPQLVNRAYRDGWRDGYKTAAGGKP